MCPVIYLSLFNKAQVKTYLAKRYPKGLLEWISGKPTKRFIEAKELVGKMKNLRCRPMLLAHIDDLLESETTDWSVYSIYDALVQAWLLREERKLGSQLDAKQLHQACRHIAFLLQEREQSSIAEHELTAMVAETPALARLSTIDVGGRSLLNNNSSGRFRFSHFSIQEFLVVQGALDGHRLASGAQRTGNMFEFARSYLHGNPTASSVSALVASGLLPRGLTLTNANLRRADLTHADLSGTNLIKSDLIGARLIGAKLSGAKLRGALLRGADLSRADLRDAELSDADLSGANLSGAKLSDAYLSRADLSDANLSGVNLIDTKLIGANLRRARLGGARLGGAKLSGADFRGADLSGAQLSGANFRDAHLGDTTLEGALVDHTTRWPPGFQAPPLAS